MFTKGDIFRNMAQIRSDPRGLAALAAYDHWVQTEDCMGLEVMKIRGNGMCWINSLVASVFGEFWHEPLLLNRWIADLCTTIMVYDHSFDFAFGLPHMSVSYGAHTLVQFLDANITVTFAIVHNVFMFCVRNYDNLDINVGCSSLLGIDALVDFDPATGNYMAIDGNMRNFILNILGVRLARVFQFKSGIDYRREVDIGNKVSVITLNSVYAGFQIESFGTVNVGGYIGSAELYSYDATHYDCIMRSSERLGLIRETNVCSGFVVSLSGGAGSDVAGSDVAGSDVAGSDDATVSESDDEDDLRAALALSVEGMGPISLSGCGSSSVLPQSEDDLKLDAAVALSLSSSLSLFGSVPVHVYMCSSEASGAASSDQDTTDDAAIARLLELDN
jgi:hypothetical protein